MTISNSHILWVNVYCTIWLCCHYGIRQFLWC